MSVGAVLEPGNQDPYLAIKQFQQFGDSTLNRRSLLGAGVLLAAGGAIRPALAVVDPLLKSSQVHEPAAAAVSDPGSGLIKQALAELARHGSRIGHRDTVAVVDFSLASNQPRLHLVDLLGGLTSTLLVAHGRGSDPANTGLLERFSNQPGSYASSSGSFLTGQTYHGKHGLSRKLIGLDPENDAAERRAIVIHSASYVSHEMARDQSRIGRSLGCFTVAQDDLARVMARLGPGRLLFAGKA